MDNNIKIIVGAVLALVVGAAGGYFYGSNSVSCDEASRQAYENGVVEGKRALLAEQKAQAEAAAQKAAEAANPYAEVEDAANPFKDTYKNPFAQ